MPSLVDACDYIPNTDTIGWTLHHRLVPSPAACCALCATYLTCFSWTWRLARRGHLGDCSLKPGFFRLPRNGSTSGVLRAKSARAAASPPLCHVQSNADTWHSTLARPAPPLPSYYAFSIAHQLEFALQMWALAHRRGFPTMIVWPAPSPLPWTRALLLELMFPHASLTARFRSCGNTEAFASLDFAAWRAATAASAAWECCTDAFLLSPGRAYMRPPAASFPSAAASASAAAAGLALGARLAAVCGPPAAAAAVALVVRHTGKNAAPLAAVAARFGAAVAVRTTRPDAAPSLCRQAEWFRGARVVVTAHGQQLANAVFADAGALLIELMPHGYYTFDFPSMYALQAYGFPYVHRTLLALPNKSAARQQARLYMRFSEEDVACLLLTIERWLNDTSPVSPHELAMRSQLETPDDHVLRC